MKPDNNNLDQLAGRVSGAICSEFYAHPALKNICLLLTPGVTFKVKSCLSKSPDPVSMPKENRPVLVKDIQKSVLSVLFTFDVDPEIISSLAPKIEKTIGNTLFDS